jgi:protein-arginine kinase activator protein McsA
MFINPKIRVIGEFKKERFYCAICQYPLLTFEDFERDREYGCCQECYLQFAESRREEWKNGWRPKKSDVNSYISIRRKLYKQSSKEN